MRADARGAQAPHHGDVGPRPARLTGEQLTVIERSCEIVSVDIPTIELAGGSVRCMIAGVHLDPRPTGAPTRPPRPRRSTSTRSARTARWRTPVGPSGGRRLEHDLASSGAPVGGDGEGLDGVGEGGSCASRAGPTSTPDAMSCSASLISSTKREEPR
ncbi:arginine deiminase-related protein [Serinicoccus marinus]|uniref:arginine deiminase-related protein n=1 Tax=Serinicoccus marinus TaxID=247333 RepID=UPI0023B1894F|nr:arginine deiminase-related protein [Serinicoccus marinus]